MKKTIFLLFYLFVSCNLFAQSSSNSNLKNSPFKNIFNSSSVEQSIRELSDVWKVDKDGVSFVIIVDSLAISPDEVINYSKEYLVEAYRPSKYKIENLNTEKLFVIGTGEFNNFESYAAFPNQYTFNCEHRLRVDAKEGKARICLSMTEYDVLRINGNKNERTKVKVKDVSPVNPNSDSSKMYNKIFLSVAKLAISTLYDIREKLQSKTSNEVIDW